MVEAVLGEVAEFVVIRLVRMVEAVIVKLAEFVVV